MMSRIMGNHNEVFSFQELHFFDELCSDPFAPVSSQKATQLFALLCAIQRNGYFGNRNIAPFMDEAKKIINAADVTTPIEVYRRFCDHETTSNGKSIPCKQTPQNVFALEHLLKAFPECRVIIMIRDPREVLLSQKNKWKRRKLSGGAIPFMESIRARLNYHPVTISKLWKATVNEGLKFAGNPSVMTIRYEDLIEDPETILKNVCGHTGITYDPSMTDIPVVGSSNFNDTKQRGVDRTKKGQWNRGGLNAAEIEICEVINGDVMEKFQYRRSQIKGSPIQLLGYRISMPFKLALTLLFNLKRLRNAPKYFKRFFT